MLLSPTTPRRSARLALGPISANATPTAISVKKPAPSPMAVTPRSLSKVSTRKKAEPKVAAEPVSPLAIEIFGETGVLEATRGPGPSTVEIFGEVGILQAEPGPVPPSPDVQWPNEWPAEWEEEWWDGEWIDGGKWAAEWDEDAPEDTFAPAPRLNTHIRFPSTPVVEVSDAMVGTPNSAASAVALAVACSGGKAVKKSKSKKATAGFVEADEVRPLSEAAFLPQKARAQIGGHARAARAAARAEAALAERVAGVQSADLEVAGPFPMLSAGASVAQRKAREQEAATRVEAAADSRAEATADELRSEMRADEIREEMYAEDKLHDRLLQLPRTPAAPRVGDAVEETKDETKPLLNRLDSHIEARVLCVAAQEHEVEEEHA